MIFSLVFQFVFLNVFIALTLIYLRESRKATKERMDILNKNQDVMIEREIKRDERKKREAKEKSIL